ncbi:MAG: hypothetical protein HC905_13685 [Bacteroidales bacterium]|nr:hypothetical protein [Bacteroidales bacterium]
MLITTKKASKDRVNVEFNSSTLFDIGFNSLPKVQEEYGIGENYNYAFGNQPTDGGSFTRANVWGPRLEGQPIAQWNSPINAVTGKGIQLLLFLIKETSKNFWKLDFIHRITYPYPPIMSVLLQEYRRDRYTRKAWCPIAG